MINWRGLVRTGERWQRMIVIRVTSVVTPAPAYLLLSSSAQHISPARDTYQSSTDAGHQTHQLQWSENSANDWMREERVWLWLVSALCVDTWCWECGVVTHTITIFSPSSSHPLRRLTGHAPLLFRGETLLNTLLPAHYHCLQCLVAKPLIKYLRVLAWVQHECVVWVKTVLPRDYAQQMLIPEQRDTWEIFNISHRWASLELHSENWS